MIILGGGGGSVDGAVASNTRDTRFEFHHGQNFFHELNNINTEKTKIKKKRPGMAHL